METFSTRLAMAIEKTGLSRPEFAARVGVGTSALAKWLNGKLRPKSDQLLELARASGVTMEWLLTGRGGEPQDIGHWRDWLTLLAVTRASARGNSRTGLIDSSELHRVLEFCTSSEAILKSPSYSTEDERKSFLAEYEAADRSKKIAMLALSPTGDYPIMDLILEEFAALLKRSVE